MLITLLTDFGEGSQYVAQMKGVILGIHSEARIVDVSHSVPPQAIQVAGRRDAPRLVAAGAGASAARTELERAGDAGVWRPRGEPTADEETHPLRGLQGNGCGG